MKIRCLYVKLVPVDELKHHPKNRNKHPEDQIKRLAQILEYQGFRYPIKVSKASGFITSGHGRLMAAKSLGLKEVPVNYQEYESEEQEYADIVADNSIASWSELDLAGINADLPELGPDFDIDLLGLKNFTLDPSENTSSQAAESSKGSLSGKFLIPPFTVLNAREGWWQERKRQWIAMGIKSELGRGGGQQVASFKNQELLEQFRQPKRPLKT